MIILRTGNKPQIQRSMYIISEQNKTSKKYSRQKGAVGIKCIPPETSEMRVQISLRIGHNDGHGKFVAGSSGNMVATLS